MPLSPAPRRARRCVAALALLAAACTDGPIGPGDGRQPAPLRALTPTETQAVRASNGFAFAMLQALAAETPTRNVLLSPLSGAAALGMTLNGAAGETRAGMQRALGIAGLTVEQANAAYRELVPLLVGADPAVTIRSANVLWPRQGFALRPAFTQTLQADYDAPVRPLDFADRARSAATINDWARERTDGLIPKVMTAEELTDDLVLLLMNALYFKGPWTARFDVARTAPRAFTLGSGAVAQVPTMYRERTALRRAGDATAEVIELPFGAGRYAMTFVMPPRGGSLDRLVAELTDARWEQLVAALRDDTVHVAVPRFELRGDRRWNDALRGLGMADAFDVRRADFAPLSDRCTPPGTCVISFVKQNVYVRVDEAGAEAAAVTTVGIGLTSAPLVAAVDRAFVFAIRERSTGAVLFAGRVVDPRG